MVRLKLQFDSLRETTAMEYATRFLFGGAVTVLASLIADRYGPVIGGLFLAFPGIFPGGISLTEKHKIEREKEAGYQGTWSARGEAAVEATGASCGTLGLVAFALVLWKGVEPHGLVPTLVCAGATWTAVSWAAWWIRERM
jgi:hypothetical protein